MHITYICISYFLIVICANVKEYVEYMAHKLKEEYEKWGLKVNMDKTQYLCTGEETTDLNLGNNEIIKK